MKRSIVLAAGLSACVLSGCVNILAQYPDPYTATDPIEFTDQFMSAAESGAINPYNIVPLWQKDTEAARIYERSTCVHGSDSGHYKVDIEKVCKRLNGVMASGYPNKWCVEREKKIPLFLVSSEVKLKKCSGMSHSFGLKVVAPRKDADPSDPNWLAYAKELGFR